eukprot:1136694-Pelagomonas_calceolata.AAC.5
MVCTHRAGPTPSHIFNGMLWYATLVSNLMHKFNGMLWHATLVSNLMHKFNRMLWYATLVSNLMHKFNGMLWYATLVSNLMHKFNGMLWYATHGMPLFQEATYDQNCQHDCLFGEAPFMGREPLGQANSFSRPCDASEAAGALDGQCGPPGAPPALTLGVQAKQTCLSGDICLGGQSMQRAMLGDADEYNFGSHGEADLNCSR